MRRFLSILVLITFSLWLGGLVMIFIAVPTLFHTFAPAPPLAGNAAAGIFHAFERYQLVLAAIGLIGVFSWRLMAREANVSDESVDRKEKRSEHLVTTAPLPQANQAQLIQRLFNSSSDLPKFIHDLLTSQAVTVGGTEAAAFQIERGARTGVSMKLISHIRPDNSSAETRATAIAAFQDLIGRCLEQNRDGAIEIAVPADAGEAQFCLITLLRDIDEVTAVSAIITRCIDAERARQRLMSMQLVGGYFELYTLRKKTDLTRLGPQSRPNARDDKSASLLKTTCFGLLSLTTIAAASSTLFITPKIDAMRLRGATYGPDFGRLHGISMSLYFAESLLLLAATALLPSIIARDGGRG